MSQYDNRQYEDFTSKNMLLLLLQRLQAIENCSDLSETAKTKLVRMELLGLECGFQNRYYSDSYSKYIDALNKNYLEFNVAQLDFKYILDD